MDPDHEQDQTTLNPRSPIDPPRICRLLLEAYDFARALGDDVWQFAVEIGCLCHAGVTRSQLRWLLAKAYVEHRIEQRAPDGDRRIFRPVVRPGFWRRSCFVLTAAGAAYAGSLEVEPAGRQLRLGPDEKPVWLPAPVRELRFGGVLVKHFKQPAAAQERILAAFQEEGWPRFIYDPFPQHPDRDAKDYLHSIVNNLNDCHKAAVIRFAAANNGESVTWRRVG